MSSQTVGTNYLGGPGAEYFASQEQLGRLGARLDAFKYPPHVRPADVVVDFGCGGGYMLDALTAARKIGIEPNPHARAAGEALGLRMVASAAEVPAGTVDVALSHHALEHSRSPYADLVALRRLLTPTGRLAIWLPLDDWRRPDQRGPGGRDENHHLYTWTPQLLWNLLEESDFAPERIEILTHAWPPKAAVLLDRLGRRRFDALAHAWALLRRRRQLFALARPAAG